MIPRVALKTPTIILQNLFFQANLTGYRSLSYVKKGKEEIFANIAKNRPRGVSLGSWYELREVVP